MTVSVILEGTLKNGEIENFTGLTFNKGERIEANGADETEIVLVSPNGTKYKITVNDAGAVSTTQVV